MERVKSLKKRGKEKSEIFWHQRKVDLRGRPTFRGLGRRRGSRKLDGGEHNSARGEAEI